MGDEQLQLNWDYNASVAKMRQLLPRWKDASIEMLGELYRAREALAPRRPGKIDVPNGTSNTWAGYLNDIGLPRMTAHRWLTMYDPERQALIEDQTDNVHFSSSSAEWYTPESIIERTRQLFGGSIQLDPCSNNGEKPNVPAETVFTKNDDGLQREWFGTVYMNPPYGRVIEDWVEKLCSEYEAGRVQQAIALIPARTDTAWFRRMVNYPRLFIWGRLQFSGHENSAPFPSMVVYLGRNLDRFKKAFADMGDAYVRI